MHGSQPNIAYAFSSLMFQFCLERIGHEYIYAECKCSFPGVYHKRYKQRLHVDKEPLKPGDTNDPRHKNQ